MAEKPVFPVPAWVVPGAKSYYSMWTPGEPNGWLRGPVRVKSITKTRVTLDDGDYVNRRDLTKNLGTWSGQRRLVSAEDIVVQTTLISQNRLVRAQRALKAIPKPAHGWTDEAYGEAIAAAEAFIAACKGETP